MTKGKCKPGRTPAWWVTVLWMSVGGVVTAQQTRPAPPDDLDRQLLQDLQPRQSGNGVRPVGPPAGEDLGRGAPPAIALLYQPMHEASRRLLAGDTGAATQQLQREVLERLRQWIDEQQQRAATSPKSAAATAPQSRDSAGGQTTDRSQGGQEPSGASTGTKQPDGPRTPGEAENQPAAYKAVVWGHLPARVREQLQAMGSEDFLPAYRELIEAYYRRLGEEDIRRPAGNEP